MILVTWGVTFYFVWFSVISNPEEVETMLETKTFNVVSATVFCVPLYFFCSGFLQTFSFMQRHNELL